MIEEKNQIEELIRRASELSLAYFELFKLRTINRISDLISGLFHNFIVGTLLLIFMLFLNLALALWLGDLFGKVYLGFLAVSLFYLVLGFASHFFMRKWLKKVVADYFIKQFFK